MALLEQTSMEANHERVIANGKSSQRKILSEYIILRSKKRATNQATLGIAYSMQDASSLKELRGGLEMKITSKYGKFDGLTRQGKAR